ncbi:peptide deformylase [Limnoglobus roseus]|uniref:Peptide deformylase n=1 Tax=Limnoglobus roseus TaxID=2598579 RepID=A0A5C1A5K9_9BACT|nr:peptide deformylase [Limnoglobus roseus]QEL13970.1 peptide deformylase [Limnoglobus roseus]
MKIVNYPHPALRAKCKPVASIDKDVRIAAGEMLELMYKREGLGLAAPQVTLDYQLIVVNFEGEPDRKDAEVVAINPVIIESKGVEKDREGCLSFPGLYQDIRRAKTVKVQYYDLDGALKTMLCSDLAARIWQHEIDHLNGVLFIDKMGPLQRFSSRNDIHTLMTEFDDDRKRGLLPADMEPKL